MLTELRLIPFATLLLASLATAQTTVSKDAGGAPSLIAHLPMDGSIVDTISGVTPTAIDGTSPTEGKIGKAIHFDGTAFVQLPVDISPQAHPELTITMWVRPDPLPDDPEQRKWFYPNAYLVSDGDGLLMIGNQQKDIPYFSAYSTGAGVSGSYHPGMRGGWQLLAVTRKVEDRTTDKGDLRPHTILTLYSNGRVSESIGVQHDKVIKPYISLGASSAGSSAKFHGAIDDVRAYAKALTPEEIRSVTAGQPGGNRGITRAASDTGSEGGDNAGAITTYGGPIETSIDATSVEPGDPSPGDLILGSDGSSSGGPPDRFGQQPSIEDIVGGFDDESGHEAADIGIAGGSPLPDATAPAVDRNMLEDTNDLDPPGLVTDQRADADPRAGVGAIGAGDPGVVTPEPIADDTQDLIGSEAGQDMLKAADWRIEGMVPNSADKPELYPGDEVTLKIRISKDDPANKIPHVRLVTNVGPGTPSPTYDLTINTADAKPADERDIQITLPVPENLGFDEGAAQIVWRPRVWLNAQDGAPLRDAIAGNHSSELALVVRKNNADDQCTRTVENADGTRTAQPCLEQEGIASRVYIDHSVLTSTALPISNDHIDDARELIVFDETHGPLAEIRIREFRDKPCLVILGSYEEGRTSADECAESRGLLNASGENLDASVGQDSVITGLSVCRNGSNNRLKGFKLQVREVNEEGSLSQSRPLLRAEHVRCSVWTPLSTCPDGQAAGGLTVIWAAQRYIHSIDLMCGAISVREEQS